MNLNEHEVTELTKNILASATQIAAKHRNPQTDVPHVILALCTNPESVSSLGAIITFDADRIHAAIESLVGPEQAEGSGNALVYTPGLTTVLDEAAEIALTEYGCEFMAPHHLLLGILKAGEEPIIRTLAQFGVTFDGLLSACKADTVEVPANAS